MNILSSVLFPCLLGACIPSLAVLTRGVPWTPPVLAAPVLAALVVTGVFWITPADSRPLISRPQGFTLAFPRINTTALLRLLALAGYTVTCLYSVLR